MSPEKFLDFITSGCLYFSPSNRFDDPLEGTCTQKDLAYLNSISQETEKNHRSHIQESKPFYAINCWHMNNAESINMWQNYTERNKGIVIESTYKRLIDSFHTAKDDVNIGIVDYINHHEDEEYTCGNDLLRFFKKDNSFSYEQELRAIKMMFKIKNGRIEYKTSPIRQEYLTQIDVTTLVESIRFSPLMSVWLCEALKKTAKQFYPELKILPSKFLKKPPHLTSVN